MSAFLCLRPPSSPLLHCVRHGNVVPPSYHKDRWHQSRPLWNTEANRNLSHLFGSITDSADISTSGAMDVPPEMIAFLALVLLVGAQTFINTMLRGNRGLRAFLSDGSGFGRSRFKPLDRNKYRRRGQDETAALGPEDPLPWLKLPKLDFVEVAGQEDPRMGSYSDPLSSIAPSSFENDEILAKLNYLRTALKQEIEKGGDTDREKAEKIRIELENLMKETGYKFNPDL